MCFVKYATLSFPLLTPTILTAQFGESWNMESGSLTTSMVQADYQGNVQS